MRYGLLTNACYPMAYSIICMARGFNWQYVYFTILISPIVQTWCLYHCVFWRAEFVRRISSRLSTTSTLAFPLTSPAELADSLSSWLVPAGLLLCSLVVISVVAVIIYAVCFRGRYRCSSSSRYLKATQTSQRREESGDAAMETAEATSQQLHRFTPTIRSQLPFKGFQLRTPAPCSPV